MKFNLEYSSKNRIIFKLFLLVVNFIALPIFYFYNFKISRFIIVYLITHFLYIFLYENFELQIRLLMVLRKKVFIYYFQFAETLFPFWSFFSFFLFFCFFLIIFFLKEKHFFFIFLFSSLKIFLYFFLLPKILYFSLFYSCDFRDYLQDLEYNCSKNQKMVDFIAKMKSSF